VYFSDGAPHFMTQERIMFSNPTPSKPHLSLTATMSDDMPSILTPPLHCASILQPAAPPQVVAFESWTISAPICFNCFTFAESRQSDLWTCVCVFTFSSCVFAFLIEMNFSFKSLFAIWSLSPQRLHYYFLFSSVSWRYQKYSTILILVLCLLRVTPLVCSSYSSFAPSSPFFSSWWQKVVSYLPMHLFSHVLHRRRRVSPRRPMYLLMVGSHYCVVRFAYALHMRPQNPVPFPCLYIELFELVIEVIFHYCTTPPCHKIDLFKRPFRGSRSERSDDASVLLVSLIFLYPQKMLICVRWSFEL